MPSEILIYGRIGEYSSTEFINKMNEVAETDDLVVRVNTNGGEPEYGWGMVAKFNEFKGNKLVKVDGKAFSMGFALAVYADNVEALDVSEFLVHRAAYPEWYEKSEYFTAELRGNLDRVNASLRAAIEAKIDVKKFEEIKGVKMKDIFSMESRIDVYLTAKEAKAIGLINKIVKITPSKRAEIQSNIETVMSYDVSIAAEVENLLPKELEDKNNLKIENKMNFEELKSKHPELYAQVFSAGSDAGVAAERDRVGSWLAFVDIDAEAVSAGIKEGKSLTATAMAEFSRKQFSKEQIGAAAADSAKEVETDKPEDKTAEEKKLADFEAGVDNILKS